MTTPVMLETYNTFETKKFEIDEQIIFLDMTWDSSIRIGTIKEIKNSFSIPDYCEYRVQTKSGKMYTVRPHDIIVENSPVRLATIESKIVPDKGTYFKR